MRPLVIDAGADGFGGTSASGAQTQRGTPTPSELKWLHYNGLAIIDVTSCDDIIRAIENGGLDKIIDEHVRYMKETDREFWAL